MMKNNSISFLFSLAIILLLLLSFCRLAAFTYKAAHTGLQMDFSAMYAAGRSLNHGFDPYRNNVDTQPLIWDGIAYYQHSRFLYPPLTGNGFQLFALFPYSIAKWLWSVFSLGGIVLAFWWLAKAMKIRPHWRAGAGVAIVAMNCYPLYILIERGQTDGIVVALLAASIYFSLKPDKKAFIGGTFLALACLLKLYLVFLLPFFFLLKKWKPLMGFAGTGVLFLLLTLSLNGKNRLGIYANQYLPRIMQSGEKGPDASRLDRAVLVRLYQNVTVPGHTEVQGKGHIKGLFEFNSSAGWAGRLRKILQNSGWKNASVAQASFVGLLLFLLLFFFLRKKVFPEEMRTDQEALFLLAGAVVTLFIGPLTWTMSLVWLLPFALVPVAGRKEMPPLVLSLFGLALLLLMLPDSKAWPSWYPKSWSFLGSKYHYVQLLILTGVILTIKKPSKKATKPV